MTSVTGLFGAGLALALLLGGCGIKGPLEPPVSQTGGEAQDLKDGDLNDGDLKNAGGQTATAENARRAPAEGNPDSPRDELTVY